MNGHRNGYHFIGRDTFPGERETAWCQDVAKKKPLHSAVALAKSVQGIKLTEIVRQTAREIRLGNRLQNVFSSEFQRYAIHFAFDEPRLGELAAVFIDRNGTNLPGPVVDIPKQPPMKQPQVVEVERSREAVPIQNQLSAQCSAALHRTEAFRVPNAESIRQAFGPWYEVWIVRYVARLPVRPSP